MNGGGKGGVVYKPTQEDAFGEKTSGQYSLKVRVPGRFFSYPFVMVSHSFDNPQMQVGGAKGFKRHFSGKRGQNASALKRPSRSQCVK